jgi:hypothetical protein
MNMKIVILLGMLILIVHIVSANVILTKDTDFDIGSDIIFTVKANETFDNALIQPNGDNAIIFTMNNSELRFTSTSAKTLSNLSYISYRDMYVYTAVGTSDPLNVTAETRFFNATYRFHVDQLVLTTNQSDSNYQVSFTFNNWSQHDFIIDLRGFNISGIVSNKVNHTLQFSNVTTGESYYVTSWNGYYLLENIPPGNYTLRSELYAYANKKIPIEINYTDIERNITMNALGGGALLMGDPLMVYILAFVGSITILWILYTGRKS